MKFLIVLKKELRDQIRSRKLLFVIILILVVAFLVLYTNVPLTEDSNGVLASIFDLLQKVCPIIGVLIAMDAVIGEKERGTLELVLSKPLSRPTLLLGKFFSYVLSIVPLFIIELVLIYYWAQTVGIPHWQAPLPPMSQWLAMIAILSSVCIFHIAFTLLVSIYARSTVSSTFTSMISIIPGSPAGTALIAWLGWANFGELALPFKAMSVLTSDYQRYAILHSTADFWICVSLISLLTIILLLVAGRSFEKQDIAFK